MARRKRRIRSRRRKVYRRRRLMAVAENRPRRRRRRYGINYKRRRRRYGSNPPAFRALGPELGWAAVGFVATKFTGNLISPMLAGVAGGGDIMRIGMKFGVAYLAAWALEMGLGRRVFVPAFVGGSLDAIQDTIKTFIAPTFPMLGEPLSMYYEAAMRPELSAYYQPQLSAGYDEAS